MKLSWLPVSQFKALMSGVLSPESWLEEAASLRLDAVDASTVLFCRDGMTPECLREAATRQGLQIAVLNTYPDFTNPNPLIRASERFRFASHVNVAARLGAKMVRVTAGQAHPGLDRAAGVKLAVEGIRWAAERLDAAGVRALFENHSKPGGWRHGDFAHPADIFIEIAHHLADAPVGILFDTANADARGDDPMAVLELVINRVECVHVADTAVRGELRPTFISAGVAPLQQIFDRLKSAGYEGWFSIEENSGDSLRGIRHAVRFVREQWGD